MTAADAIHVEEYRRMEVAALEEEIWRLRMFIANWRDGGLDEYERARARAFARESGHRELPTIGPTDH